MTLKTLIPLVVGFLLTSVLGGILAFFFQRRQWTHQHAVQQEDLRRENATQVFEEVSRLLDKRLYRQRRRPQRPELGGLGRHPLAGTAAGSHNV